MRALTLTVRSNPPLASQPPDPIPCPPAASLSPTPHSFHSNAITAFAPCAAVIRPTLRAAIRHSYRNIEPFSSPSIYEFCADALSSPGGLNARETIGEGCRTLIRAGFCGCRRSCPVVQRISKLACFAETYTSAAYP